MSCYAGAGNEAQGSLDEQTELFIAKPKKHFFLRKCNSWFKKIHVPGEMLQRVKALATQALRPVFKYPELRSKAERS